MFYILLPTREHVFSSYIYFKLNKVYVSWCLRSAWSSYLISVLMQWWEKNKVVSCLYPVKVSLLNNLAALKKLEFLFFFIQVKINTNISSNISSWTPIDLLMQPRGEQPLWRPVPRTWYMYQNPAWPSCAGEDPWRPAGLSGSEDAQEMHCQPILSHSLI